MLSINSLEHLLEWAFSNYNINAFNSYVPCLSWTISAPGVTDAGQAPRLVHTAPGETVRDIAVLGLVRVTDEEGKVCTHGDIYISSFL